MLEDYALLWIFAGLDRC